MRHEPVTKADREPLAPIRVPARIADEFGRALPADHVLTELIPAAPRAFEPCEVPGCARSVLRSQLAYVGDCPPEVFGGAKYACDGCRSTAILTGRITPEDFVRYTGGSPAAIDRARIKADRERTDGNLPHLPDIK